MPPHLEDVQADMQELRVWMQSLIVFLDDIISAIGDVNIAQRVHRHALREIECAVVVIAEQYRQEQENKYGGLNSE